MSKRSEEVSAPTEKKSKKPATLEDKLRLKINILQKRVEKAEQHLQRLAEYTGVR